VILQPGIPLTVFPTFHMPIDLRDRLLLSAGVDRHGDAFVPRPPWRRPDEREMRCLCADVASSSIDALRDAVCLFHLPRHLRLAWGTILDRALETGLAKLTGFDAFVADVSRFLAFKEMPVPDGAAVDLVVNKPGNPTWLVAEPIDAWWGGVNLGDEPTSLVYVNVSDSMRRALPPDYPAVRLRIDPGEGFRLPSARIAVASCTLDKSEPDILMRIATK
jgi:hypothetical protein